jgi:hypothetical protein
VATGGDGRISANHQAFQDELRRVRDHQRGDILRATASFECLNERSVRLLNEVLGQLDEALNR